MHNRRWTPEQLADLLRMYPDPRISHGEMMVHFQRNISANGPRAPIIDRTLNASGLGLPRKHRPLVIAAND